MLLDDDPDYSFSLQLALEQSRLFEVVVEMHPEEAIARMRQVRPAILILDLLMPRMNGTEVYQAMRQCDDLATLPVLVVSAMVESTKPPRPQEIAPGLMGLPKPVDADSLIGAILAILRPS